MYIFEISSCLAECLAQTRQCLRKNKTEFNLLKSVGNLDFHIILEQATFDELVGDNFTFVFGINSHILPYTLDMKKWKHIYTWSEERKKSISISNVLKMIQEKRD